jgi:hypothetical protein
MAAGWANVDLSAAWVIWGQSVGYGIGLGVVAVTIALVSAYLWHGDR